MDTDTITTKPLDSLREYNGFCGLEPVALPANLYQSKNPLQWTLAGIRLGFRQVLAHTPRGFQFFRKIEPFYPSAVNNAILGSKAQNPFIGAAFRAILNMDAKTRTQQFRLGTHLLQKLTHNHSSENMQVLPSEFFFPLGPEISNHWFRKNSAKNLHKLILPNTHVIHWYHSVENRLLKEPLSQAWLRKNPDTAISKIIGKYS